MAVNGKNMLPLYLLKNPTFRELLKAEDIELKDFENYVEEVRNELNITTANLLIDRYEKIFGISQKGTKSERVGRILSKLNTIGTCKVSDIKNIVRLVIGRECEVKEYYEDYSFDVIVKLFFEDETSLINQLKEQIEELRPAHLAYQIITSLEILVFKNRYNVRLNSLKMSLKTGSGHYLNGFYVLDGTYTLGSSSKDIKFKKVSMGINEKTFNGATAFIVEDTLWNLNGEFSLNGEKKINADIRREML